MNDIDVIVTGSCGSGKSTIVALIEKTMEEHGYKVSITGNVNTEPREKRMIRANDPRMIAAVADKAHISITEKQSNRRPLTQATA